MDSVFSRYSVIVEEPFSIQKSRGAEKPVYLCAQRVTSLWDIVTHFFLAAQDVTPEEGIFWCLFPN